MYADGAVPAPPIFVRGSRRRNRPASPQADDLEDADGPDIAIALPEGTKVVRDIAYGPDAAQRLDVYLPEHPTAAPVIFLVHGGGWRRGDKAMGSVVTNKVARWLPQGYVVISVNYRLAPQAGPLEQADDVAMALAFAQSKAASWGADAARFVLMGGSAGRAPWAAIGRRPRHRHAAARPALTGHRAVGQRRLQSGADYGRPTLLPV